MISDSEMSELGLQAMGDIKMLRSFCQQEDVRERVAVSVKRRTELLHLVRTGSSSSKQQRREKSVDQNTGGRPSSEKRLMHFGLRVLASDEVDIRQSRSVPSPLGDGNTIQLPVPKDHGYDELLKWIVRSFFPGNKNPVIGEVFNFIAMELVNNHNYNIKHKDTGWTIGCYIKDKMIGGSVRLYLLCTPGGLDTASDVPSLELRSDDHPLQELTSEDISHEIETSPFSSDMPGRSSSDMPGRSSSDMPGRSSTDMPGRSSTDMPGRSSSDMPGRSSSDISDEIQPSWASPSSHIERAIQKTLERMRDCLDAPVIIGIFAEELLTGRPLDITDASQAMQRVVNDTAAIDISRYNLMEDAMNEVLALLSDDTDLTMPLEVTFMGEKAHDLGGPRREFLTKVMLAIKGRLFIETKDGFEIKGDEALVFKKWYQAAGVLIGISMLQGGPMPSFFSHAAIEKLMSNKYEGTDAEEQLKQGLDKLGIIKLLRRKPCLRYLFRVLANETVTYRRLVRLLVPKWANTGSNTRRHQEKAYRRFLDYLKAVSSGRRSVTLGNVLQFTTGSNIEPMVGYGIPPSVEFRELPAFLPIANTCICQLTIPMGKHVDESSDDLLYERFDYAFMNDYFGIV